MSLEEALQELREYCRGMPPVAAMQVEVEGMRGDALRLTAPLSANVNDKGNAFGGSLTSLMTVAGCPSAPHVSVTVLVGPSGLANVRTSVVGETSTVVFGAGVALARLLSAAAAGLAPSRAVTTVATTPTAATSDSGRRRPVRAGTARCAAIEARTAMAVP